MGVPRPALGWGACDPNNPKNRRRRTSLLVERNGDKGVTKVLVDTSPDLREQLLDANVSWLVGGLMTHEHAHPRHWVDTSPARREQLLDANVSWLDGVLMTHEHADHCHGIDDLRALFVAKRRRLDMYTSEQTSKTLRERFGYCFETPPGSEYPPIAREHRIAPGEPVTIDGEGGPITALPILQSHGDIPSLGFRFGGFGYSCDLNDMPRESVKALTGLEVW